MQEYRLEEPRKPSISSLISGIFRDASDLISKEIMSARLEMREEMANAKSTAVLIGVGAACLLLGGILLSFTVVYVLEQYTELVGMLRHRRSGAVGAGPRRPVRRQAARRSNQSGADDHY